MTIEELRCALAVEPDDSFLDEEALPDRGYLLSVCCGLIITSGDNDVVRFVHYTTQEYFERASHSQLSAAQRYLAHVCITYLSFSAFSTESFVKSIDKISESSAEKLRVVDQRKGFKKLENVVNYEGSMHLLLQEHILLVYAAQNWGNHAREAIKRDPAINAINAIVSKFLAKKTNVSYSMEVKRYHDEHFFHVYRDTGTDVTDLHVTAAFGLESLSLKILDEGATVDAKDANGVTALHYSSMHGHTVVAQMLLDNGANPNLKNRDGQGALLWAAAMGFESIVRLLLGNDEDLLSMEHAISRAAREGHSGVVRIMLDSVKDVTSKTTCLGSAAQHASASGQEACVRLLLDEGKDLAREARRLHFGEALARAADSNHCVIMQLLLEQGADVNHKAGILKATPLHEAACEGHKEAAVYLLDNGAEIESADCHGNRPIHSAISRMREQNTQTSIMLLERGADVNAYGIYKWSPLMIAAARGYTSLMPHLLRYGADTMAKDKHFNRTAIEWAVLEGHVSAVQMLLTSQYSASMKEGLLALTRCYHALDDTPDNKDDQSDVSQLLLGVQNTFSDDLKGLLLLHRPSSNGDEAVTRAFIAMGADVNAYSYEGDMALHRAARYGHLKIVRLLLDHGALLEALYNRWNQTLGITPLGIAVLMKNYRTIQLLLDEGANVEHDSGGRWGTPLMLAVQSGQVDIARLLLDHGADPNTKSDSDTAANALDAAFRLYTCDLNILDTVQLLIKKGANIEAKNTNGESALCKAVGRGWVKAVSLLLECGADPNAVQETSEPCSRFTYEEDFSTSMQLIRDAKQRQAEVQKKLSSENVKHLLKT
jgi:ankyrin repeat protein